MLKVALIGLDSSHTIEFARRMLGRDCDESQHVKDLQPIGCYRFESLFQDKAGQDSREQMLFELGVPLFGDMQELCSKADVIMLEINDPSLHLEYFSKVFGLGKPIFLDKPLAENMVVACEILKLAEAQGTRFFTSSALRFDKAVVEAARKCPSPQRVSVWGPLGEALSGSSVVWYGVHTVEMLQKLMGKGAQNVRVLSDEKGILAHVGYSDGRRGVIEMTYNVYRYGSVLHDASGLRETMFAIETGADFYGDLLHEVCDFFHGEKSGVELADMVESMAVLDAIDRATISGKNETVIR